MSDETHCLEVNVQREVWSAVVEMVDFIRPMQFDERELNRLMVEAIKEEMGE